MNTADGWIALVCTTTSIWRSLLMSYRMQSAIWTPVSLWIQLSLSSWMPWAGLLLLPRFSGLLLPNGWWVFPPELDWETAVCTFCLSLPFPPMAECTADRHFVFSIPATLTEPPLTPTLLVAAGNSSCTPQKVVADLAIFKIPLDGCGTHKYVCAIVLH